MGLILVRYAELGLKSRAVRRRFESILVSNIMDALAYAGVEAVVATEQGRVFVESTDSQKCLAAIVRVFGVASASHVIKVPSDMQTMQVTAAEFSRPMIRKGQSFAVRARRVGEHSYTSTDVGREVGSAIYLANEEKGIRVDLTDPDVEFFVEVRSRSAYIFSEYVPGPGGLPLGSQGRALALLEKPRDALAAWLIMKRGCRIIAISPERNKVSDILRAWDPHLKVLLPSEWNELVKRNRAVAVVFGYGVDELSRMQEMKLPVPAFYPLAGIGESEIEERLKGIGG
ncbi:MAG TPA: THUMP domain-containing protein [Methanomassiliicoccales archaeon]|nr:THUMP domain-containing protein [Methanomassiliicoccales archaeon]